MTSGGVNPMLNVSNTHAGLTGGGLISQALAANVYFFAGSSTAFVGGSSKGATGRRLSVRIASLLTRWSSPPAAMAAQAWRRAIRTSRKPTRRALPSSSPAAASSPQSKVQASKARCWSPPARRSTWCARRTRPLARSASSRYGRRPAL